MSEDPGLRVGGGAGGAAARLEDLDALTSALLRAAADAGALAARAACVLADPGLLAAIPSDPAGVARVVVATGRGAGSLCRGAGTLAGLSAAVAAAVAAYRAREEALAALARGMPLVLGSVVRGRATVLAALPLPGGPVVGWAVAGAAGGAGAAGLAGAGAARLRRAGGGAVLGGAGAPGQGVLPVAVREAVVGAVVSRPALVDGVVRVLPGLLGVPDVATAARLAGGLGRAGGTVRETGVSVRPVESAPCSDPGTPVPVSGGADAAGRGPGADAAGAGAPAGGVADLLRRGQTVAAWRAPRPGEHDSLPPGQPRPVAGQVRLDRVQGADGALAWVVHVPGTQDWDGDGTGSPMDMAANLALVGGRRSAVADGVAAALLGAGARPGQPVLLVGHSQGGMTALDLAADPALRRAASVTHVVTAGSPVTGRTPPPGVQVLALEHDDDLVPRLDGRTHPDRRDRVVVRAPAPTGPWRTDAVPAHSSSAYVVTGAAVDASAHPSLVAFRAGLAPFLDREGATCTSRQVVLARSGPPGDVVAVPAAGEGGRR